LMLLVSPDTSFPSIASALKSSSSSPLIIFSVALFICGLLIKGGLVPFHGWLPDAYASAPAPVSVLLAGIITKACGIYTLIRLVTAIFGFTDPVKNTIMFTGILSILVGAFAALGQNNLKRLLAYSSISQVGYIILGLGTGTPLGIAGAAFHLFNHSIFKSLLFVNSAAVEEETGTVDIDKMGGISARMPTTGATSVIAVLSASGIPPLSGFWSKLMIVVALWQCGRYGYAITAVLAGVLTLAYLLKIEQRVFFGKLKPGLEYIKEPGLGIISISVVLAAITIGAGLFFPIVYTKLIMPIGMIAQ
ncbi:MAG TPA: proton-conducting transporter membrane subunit, partial [Candidatus Omnitrophota bacterium]|nr:proton-conducting transporter membrane subunit [Candidatus Omnitrophota bacterium]